MTEIGSLTQTAWRHPPAGAGQAVGGGGAAKAAGQAVVQSILRDEGMALQALRLRLTALLAESPELAIKARALAGPAAADTGSDAATRSRSLAEGLAAAIGFDAQTGRYYVKADGSGRLYTEEEILQLCRDGLARRLAGGSWDPAAQGGAEGARADAIVRLALTAAGAVLVLWLLIQLLVGRPA